MVPLNIIHLAATTFRIKSHLENTLVVYKHHFWAIGLVKSGFVCVCSLILLMNSINMNGSFLAIKETDSYESICSGKDEAVWNWSHAIGCFMGVEVGGEWEEEARGRNNHRGIQTDGQGERLMLVGVEHPDVCPLHSYGVLSLCVSHFTPLLRRRTPVSPRPLDLPFCFSHPPTLSQHHTFSTLSSPAASTFYESVK